MKAKMATASGGLHPQTPEVLYSGQLPSHELLPLPLSYLVRNTSPSLGLLLITNSYLKKRIHMCVVT